MARPPSLQGIWAPLVTPVDEGLAIDGPRLAAHAQRVLAEGCQGVVLFGTTGEAPSFAVAQRQAALEALLDAGVQCERIVVGATACALSDAVALSLHALQCGVDHVLVMPPFFFRHVDDEGLIAYFTALLQRLPPGRPRLLLYHFPKMSGLAITLPVILALRQRFGVSVAGLKDSSGDPEQLALFAGALDGVALFPGTERLLLRGLQLGAAGCISATANLNAAAQARLFRRHLEGGADLRAEQNALDRQRQVLERWPLAPALKAVLALRDRDDGWRRVCPPLASLSSDDARTLLEELSCAGMAWSAGA
ncbi:MAG: dihydrodipicolinate synthase family protein [Pseudomonadota bacterium]